MHADLLAVQGALAAAQPHWVTLEVQGERARVAPALSPAQTYARLDEAFGETWGLAWHLESAAPTTVRCTLTLLGTARDGLGQALSLEGAQAAALSDAARAWGLLPAQLRTPDTWVDYDPEEGPNTDELSPEPGEDAPPPASRAPEPPPENPQMVKARRHLDDLMDQLREAGLGAQAARVIAKHGGGYGKDVDESRRIYSELKALQKS